MGSGLDVNAEKTKYIFMSWDQHAGQNHDIEIGNKSFKNVFRYLGTDLTNQKIILEEIKSRLKSGNACYHSVQNFFALQFANKNIKIKVYRTVILLVVFRCGNWCLTLREEGRLRVFENRLLRKIFGPKKDEITEDWRRLQNEGFYYLFSPYIIQVIKSRRWDGWSMWHVWEMGEMCAGLWWGDLRERDHLEDLFIDGSIILKCIFKKWDGEACTGLFLLRTGRGDGPLWMWY